MSSVQGLALNTYFVRDMKFIADEMLGKLARWLRMLGYDTVYNTPTTDSSLVNQAFREQRIIITRDTRLVERKLIPRYILIKSDKYIEQLRQVIKELNLVPDKNLFFSRCLLCNTEIEPIPKGVIKTKVPPYVYETQDNFLHCPRCDRIYWAGTHVEKAKGKLQEVLWYEKP